MDARTTQTVQTADRVSAFIWKVYGWMAVGIGLTAVVAFAVAGSPEIMRVLIGNRLVFFALVIALLWIIVASVLLYRGSTSADHRPAATV